MTAPPVRARPAFPSGRLALRTGTVCLPMAIALAAPALTQPAATSSVADTIARTQPKVVKIYGAGGFRGLEPYQSGLLISPAGHLLTAWSYVLDTDQITVTLADGQRFSAELLGADPRLEIAVLKIDAEALPAFDLDQAADVAAGTRVLAFSNLFGVATGNEAASVQHGVISVKTRLEARRGTFQTPYTGPVYVLDAVTNNPGAAGGALVTRQGELVGMLGKELRNARNNTWLNYALPIDAIRDSLRAILAGEAPPEAASSEPARPDRPLKLEELGIVLVPDVVERTPPYVDAVRPGSPAHHAGLLPDDLIVLVNHHLIQSSKHFLEELAYIDYQDPVTLTVLRDHELLEFTLQANAPNPQVP